MPLVIAILAGMAILFGAFVFVMNIGCHIVSIREQRFVSAVLFVPTVFAGGGMLALPPLRPYWWLPLALELGEYALGYAAYVWKASGR